MHGAVGKTTLPHPRHNPSPRTNPNPNPNPKPTSKPYPNPNPNQVGKITLPRQKMQEHTIAFKPLT